MIEFARSEGWISAGFTLLALPWIAGGLVCAQVVEAINELEARLR
jgi:hypothetical protein